MPNNTPSFNKILSRLSSEDANRMCIALGHMALGTRSKKQLLIYGGHYTGKSTFINLGRMMNENGKSLYPDNTFPNFSELVDVDTNPDSTHPAKVKYHRLETIMTGPAGECEKCIKAATSRSELLAVHNMFFGKKWVEQKDKLIQHPFFLNIDTDDSLKDSHVRYIRTFFSTENEQRIVKQLHNSYKFLFEEWNAPAMVATSVERFADQFYDVWDRINLPDEPVIPDPTLYCALKEELPLIKQYVISVVQKSI